MKGMKVNGKMGNFMGKALRLCQTAPFLMVNGSKADPLDQACASIQMELNTLETGLMGNLMVKE